MIEAAIKEAAKSIPLYWPLTSFIATNPLWELHDKPLPQVIETLRDVTHIEGVMPIFFYQEKFIRKEISIEDLETAIEEYSNKKDFDLPVESLKNNLLKCVSLDPDSGTKQNVSNKEDLSQARIADIYSKIQNKIINFLMHYFHTQPPLNSTKEQDSILNSWRQQIARFDNHLKEIADWIEKDKAAVISQLLNKISFDDRVTHFKRIFYCILGWSSLIKWLEQRPDNPHLKKPAQLIDLIVIWLCYEKYYEKDLPPLSIRHIKIKEQSINTQNKIASHEYPFIWQRAFEIAYERTLTDKLRLNQVGISKLSQIKPMVQAIFCIDTRSEGLRRWLEKRGGYETFGFAGFFGFVFSYEKNHECHSLQCPALFPPEIHLVNEYEQNYWQKQSRHFLSSCHQTKKSLLAPLVFVEITGIWFGWNMLTKTLSGRAFRKCKQWLGYGNDKNPLQDKISSTQVNKKFSLETKVNNAKQFLKTIGLTKNFAPIILICGYGGETDNNPYQASFDCGACGGNAGFSNAIVATHILNDLELRSELKTFNIHIPNDTLFVAGFHNTTQDQVALYEEAIPEPLKPKLNKLKQDLKIACSELLSERSEELPGLSSALNRASNWSELIPEMGLINNAALIVGPRHLTQHISLERRVFLHSYDPAQDPDGELLSGILLGPQIVAHWINAQYYFSTTDPHIFGSGNKMLHNVLPNIGVIEGNFSDLKIGLPWQSVGFQNKVLHQPLRLLVLIYAPKKRVDDLLDKHPTIKALFTQQWAHLKIIEPGD